MSDRYQHYELTLRRFYPFIKPQRSTELLVNCADQWRSRGEDDRVKDGGRSDLALMTDSVSTMHGWPFPASKE
jgi:hypothetical protein